MGLGRRTWSLCAHHRLSFYIHCRSESFSTSRRKTSTPSNTSTRLVVSDRKPSQISSKREGYSKRSVATLQPAWPPPAVCFGSHPVSSPSHRSITPSLSICVMPFKTMRTVFSSSTSCLGATSDVSARGVELSSSSKRFHLISFLVHLERLGRLSEEAVQLYTAELSSALSYLHEKRIIHRCVYSRFLFSSNSRLSHFGCI